MALSKKALSARVNKSDVNDAESLAQLCRTGGEGQGSDDAKHRWKAHGGWFKPVHMKAGATHIDRAGDCQ